MQNKKETDKEIAVKNIIILDLSKQSHTIAQRIKEFMQMYDVVKNERNKYVNMIQATQQASAEMKEKTGILQNEIDILQSESVAKDKASSKEHSEHINAIAQRDALRSELNRSMFAFRERQETIDQQIAEIDKLNSVISCIEQDIVRLKKQYETAVEERNYTGLIASAPSNRPGIQLIDRNDELCILYEKCNIQENIMRRGQTEFLLREEEIQMLHRVRRQLEWKIEVVKRLLPRIPEYEGLIMGLKDGVEQERVKAKQLSFDLENPANEKRFRRLDGKLLEPEQITVKMDELETRLNEKKEQLLEKELLLEEISSRSEKLRRQATEGRGESLQLAQRVNDLQVAFYLRQR